MLAAQQIADQGKESGTPVSSQLSPADTLIAGGKAQTTQSLLTALPGTTRSKPPIIAWR
jgi:hypothetical protein